MEYSKHYTREEARALLPQIKQWLKAISDLRRQLKEYDRQLGVLAKQQCDSGGELVNSWVRVMAEMKAVFLEFDRREIQIKDLERGLVDFPALIAEKEVFLCWEKGEADIGFWHEIQAGYAGRQPLDEDL